jgi:prephenate dehydrogenase
VRVAVIGVGLIGGSVALAAKEALGATVAGYDPDPAVREAALARGALDDAAADVPAAVAGAELAFVATPVGALPEAISEVLSAAGEDCAVTDVGSTKRAVVAGVEDRRFVGGHPLAGAETSGIEHARADLFAGATWYVTPTAAASGILLERVMRSIAALGARPVATDAETHDRLMASVSHLPHVLANVLVAQAARTLSRDAERLPPTGPSFRDATRVAGADGSIWTDIYLSNRDALGAALEDTIERLVAVRAALGKADRTALESWNEGAAADRRALLEAGLAGGDVHELRASVPNRPGVIADIALALGHAGVNIVDMALSPSQDMSQGLVALWVLGEDEAARAAELIGDLGIPVARA